MLRALPIGCIFQLLVGFPLFLNRMLLLPIKIFFYSQTILLLVNLPPLSTSVKSKMEKDELDNNGKGGLLDYFFGGKNYTRDSHTPHSLT